MPTAPTSTNSINISFCRSAGRQLSRQDNWPINVGPKRITKVIYDQKKNMSIYDIWHVFTNWQLTGPTRKQSVFIELTNERTKKKTEKLAIHSSHWWHWSPNSTCIGLQTERVLPTNHYTCWKFSTRGSVARTE